MTATRIPASISEHTDFQVLLKLAPEPNEDEHLDDVAQLAVIALLSEAAGLALGPVATINLDERTVTLEITVEATSASEAHQKMGLIIGALERGAPLMINESTTSRNSAPDDEPERVCA